MSAVPTGMGAAGGHPPADTASRKPLRIADGSLHALKWLGLVLMTLDHVNKYLLQGQAAWMFEAGRLVMPLFSFVLAYNLAREGPGTRGAAARTARRLVVVGLLATPICWLLQGPWPLNILLTLASAAAVISLLENGRTLAGLALALAGGFLVEFWWPAIGATIAAWYFCRSPSWRPALAWTGCIAALTPVNGNLWAFACVPLLFIAASSTVRLPRSKWFFYAYYPAHLGVVWCAQRML